MAVVGNTKVTPQVWNGNYPLPDLPVGQIWKGAYGGGWECVGFARMVLDATYGAGPHFGPTKDLGGAEQIKALYEGVDPGDRVTFATRKGTQHALIVAGKTKNGILAYDCNRVRPNTIGLEELTWSRLFRMYSRVLGGVHHK